MPDTTFNEALHPRDNASKQFVEKAHSGPEGDLLGEAVTGPVAPVEKLRHRRGHDFYPKDFASWPAIYASEGTPESLKPVVAHYFGPDRDFYIVESDGEGEAFGYAHYDAFPEGAEWGYIDLKELEAYHGGPLNIVERDLMHDPNTMVRDCIPKYMVNRNPVEQLPYSTKVPGFAREPLRHRRDEFRQDLIALDGGPGGAADLFVDSILEGHLSRGTPGESGANALTAWRVTTAVKAADETLTDGEREAYADFYRGLNQGAVELMRSKLIVENTADGEWVGGKDLEPLAQQATVLAKTKRASQKDRALWQETLQHATSEAEWRGMLVAGAALSGTDSWWGFRDNTHRTVTGPTPTDGDDE